MKKTIILIFYILISLGISAQQKISNTESGNVIFCSEFHISKPLSELAKDYPIKETKKKNIKDFFIESRDKEHRTPQKFIFSSEKDGSIYSNDPALIQKSDGTEVPKAPLQNWLGQTASGFRPYDPSGAAGTTYYMQAINSTTYNIYNKTTGVSVLTGSVGSLWAPSTANDGDPIIMYDRFADRWFVSQFGITGNRMYIAISTTNNPMGTYYCYTFTSPVFPDYLKFSIWQDGYYMTSNQSPQRVFAFERSAMLVGNPAAKVVSQTYAPPSGAGFFCPMPGDADGGGGLPAAGTPCPIFSYSDNAWGGGATDAILIYNMAVNWAVPSAAITLASTINTAAFDASYNAAWNDISQPVTAQKLDGIGGILQYRAQCTSWGTYRSTVLTWPVKISATQRSLMWCELKQNIGTGAWSLYQQSIYAPDTKSRWLGSIAMNDCGSIALCYARASATAGDYMSLYYAGRLSTDPINTLSIAETIVIAGTGYQTGTNRSGDYSQTTIDPDGITFWHTGEYMGGASGASAARTRVYSFKLCSAILPIELISLKAENIENNKININWETSSESNNDYFTLEKSKNGIEFEFLNSQKSTGNSNSIKLYSFIDDKPYKDISYYRLKQTDYDGKTTIAGITSVNNSNTIKTDISFYPNPFNNEINFEFTNLMCPNGIVVLTDYTGRKVYEIKINEISLTNNKFTINLSELHAGIYIAKFKSNNFEKVFKINKN
jgi:hypothetical protein